MNVTLEREIEVEFEATVTGQPERWRGAPEDSSPSEEEVEVLVQSATILGVELSRDMKGKRAVAAINALLNTLAEDPSLLAEE